VIVPAGNYEVCKATFDKAPFVYPTQHLELRQGARDMQVRAGEITGLPDDLGEKNLSSARAKAIPGGCP
jgi:hypothetical protein